MTDEKKSLVEKFTAWLNAEDSTKVELADEPTVDEPTEEKLESVLEDGTYELADGRSIVIDGGNVTEVLPAAEEEAPAEEEMAKEETEKAEESKLSEELPEDPKAVELAKQKEVIEALELKLAKLEEAKPLSNAPQKKAPKQLIELNSNMSYAERVAANIHNNL